ncbi:MAG: transcriptional regulator [Nostocaceae cyanobacterium]|nr:transcriptional regulator [Nostocaceae cyanobacterium]
MTKTTGKITLTFNPQIYSQLLSQHQPWVIKTEEDNEKFLEVVEELLSHPHLTLEEDALLELLVKLIEDFEDKYYQLNASTPQSRLLHLMEAQNLSADDLVSVLGSSEIVDGVINGKLEITQEQAEALGRFFHVDSSLFF